jgi:hypothetical protein
MAARGDAARLGVTITAADKRQQQLLKKPLAVQPAATTSALRRTAAGRGCSGGGARFGLNQTAGEGSQKVCEGLACSRVLAAVRRQALQRLRGMR